MTTFGFQPPVVGTNTPISLLRELAIRAEAAGYDALSATDHVVTPAGMTSQYPYSATGRMYNAPTEDRFDIFALLGYWAAVTTRIRLQTSVLVVPYRNPVLAAKMLASVDALSQGRLEVGVGVGWLEEEFQLLAAPDFHRRGQVTDEYLQVYRALWAEEPASFEGAHYRFEQVAMYPKPATPAGPPILVGGITPPALRRAARLGDGWQALKVRPDDVRLGIQAIREEAHRVGRALPPDFEVSIRFGMRITDKPTERQPFESPDRVFVGNPDYVATELQSFIDAGATAFMLDVRSCDSSEAVASMESFARDVLPRFAG